MIESIQRAHGRRTGLYTSPHLIELGERVQINRESIYESRLVNLVEELRGTL
jgi:dihydrofolate synthase/folylpolyglutamate synthase